MKNVLLTVLALFILSSCEHKVENKVDVITRNASLRSADIVVEKSLNAPSPRNTNIGAGEYVDAPSAPNERIDTSKKIIKEGEISFESGNLKITRAKILHALKNLQGYIAAENETNNSDSNTREFVMQIRVPSKNFDLLLDSISSNADKIDSKNIKIEDVTTQYIDIKTELANKKILENTYLELLKKTNKMEEVLQIEAKLTDIRTTIDSIQGQLNYLNKQVAYSSLAVTFYTKTVQLDNGYGIGYRFGTAVSGGWGLLQDLFFGIVALWPFILLTIALYLLVKRWRKRRKAKKAPAITVA